MIKWDFNRRFKKFSTYWKRVKLPKKKWHTCITCDGLGVYYQERNLHESGGMVPCTHCDNGICKHEWVKL